MQSAFARNRHRLGAAEMLISLCKATKITNYFLEIIFSYPELQYW
jgi:hypothetical protein